MSSTRMNRPMRVGVDLRWMYPGIAGGIENLSRSYLGQIQRIDRYNQYTVLVPSKARFDLNLHRSPNFRVVAADGPGRAWRRLKPPFSRLLHSRTGTHRKQRPEPPRLSGIDVEADVFLSTGGSIQPDLFPHRNVLVVIDLQHEFFPEFFSRQESARRKESLGESIRRADHMIAISDHTRQTFIERLGVAPDSITTAHLAADPVFLQANRTVDPERVLQKYRLEHGSYLFFPANSWPHKNHSAAFKALKLLRDEHSIDPLLACSGTAREAQPELLRLIGQLGLEQRVRFLGYCPLEDMPGLYEGAAALVYPSYFEGFGIPLVEAMWSGCPIVCSNVTSLPEIAGDSALLVDPASPAQLASAIYRLLTDSALRQTLVDRGRERAHHFSWQRFALAVTRALHQVSDGGQPFDWSTRS